jgi:hypothetical protein
MLQDQCYNTHQTTYKTFFLQILIKLTLIKGYKICEVAIFDEELLLN